MDEEYHGQERRRMPLSESQLDDIAERAAKKALDYVYQEVGRSVLRKLAWITGAVIIGLFIWLSGIGKLPK